MMTTGLEWAGCVLGAVGALLLAMNRPYSGWGWIAFLGSNACWIVFGLTTGLAALVAMQVVMTVTSLLGVYRWLLRAPASVHFRARKERPC